MIPKTRRRVVLARRPPAEVAQSDFRIEEAPVHIVEGIDTAPRAFIGLLRGATFGRMQVKLGPDPIAR